MIGASIALLASAGVVLHDAGPSRAFKKIVFAAGFCIGWLLWDVLRGSAS